MLNSIIRAALRFRLLTITAALALVVYGGWVLSELPIDVFPDLNRPRVTIMTEAPGLAPEEVETQITAPLEAVLNGAPGVQAVRSSSGIGLSVIDIEFDWGTNIYLNRQIVTERIATATDRLPAGTEVHLTPISSIMGQIVQVALYSESGETDPRELRSLADWVVRRRLLNIPGVAQVVTMGGGRKQHQVLVDADALLEHGVTLEEVQTAVAASNENGAGGYLDEGSRELLVRSLGRLKNIDQLDQVVVKGTATRPILLGQVARIVEGEQIKRGDAALNGRPCVMLTISKQPGSDTRGLTELIVKALDDLQPTLPADVRIESEVYQQKGFIDLSIHNVIEALRDGGILVVIVLFLFLLNFRTTFITLTAIPLSIVVTALVFKWTGQSINTMTLGGLAVAIGELVDDAIVDVENIFRRLKENRLAGSPKSPLRVVYEASSEVRNSIVFSTLLVVLVFVPLFALEGMEGRLFAPLGLAYIVSILASLAVSLTVTPVLSYWLLPSAPATAHERDGFLLRFFKWLAGGAIRLSLWQPWPILLSVLAMVAVSVGVVLNLGRDFLPPFNEGTVQLNVIVPPGASLATSNHIAGMVEEQLKTVPEVVRFGRRTGRAEMDEHVEGVNASEIIITLDPESPRSRTVILDDLRERTSQVPGAMVSAEQPLQHLISHMLSGVKAQVGIKIYGDDLNELRRAAQRVKAELADVPGVADLLVEPQTEIPQLQIVLRPDQLSATGLTARQVNEFVETALGGRTVSEVLQGDRRFDLVVRLDDAYRTDLEKLRRLSIHLPAGGRVPLSQLADIRHGSGPNTINRENARRRIIVQCNVSGRDLGGVVTDIQQRLAATIESLPPGYFVEFGGQFESQQRATRRIALLSLVSLAGMFVALFTLFRSVNLSLQVLAALPMAAIGAVAALWITGQSLTVASMVGFVSLSGIASRNGILLIAHYLHLVQHEGEQFTPQMIVRAGQERVAPMLMTALTAGIALVPLVLAAGEPGKEILFPVATVILGGLISSTLLDFFVHPALFWLFGRKQAEGQTHDAREDELLAEPIEAHEPEPDVART
jgi:CzcA family heavy metal efflux pump